MDPRVVAAEWAWSLPFFLACTVPGAGVLAWLMHAKRSVALNAAEFGALAFAITVASISALASVVWLAGGTLIWVGIAWALLAGAGVASVLRHGRELRGRIEGGWSGLAIAGGAALVCMLQRPWFFTSSDIFYHVAAVRSLVRSGQVLVSDPIYGTTTRLIDPTSGIWHSVQAAFASALGVEPSTLFLSAMGVGAFVVVASVWALLRRVTGRDDVAMGCTLLLLVASGRIDLRTSGYPNEITFGLGLLFATLLGRAIERRDHLYAVGAGVVGFATVTTHLGGAEFVGLLGLATAFWILVVARLSRNGEEPVPARAAAYPIAALAIAFVPGLPVLLPRLLALRGSSAIGDSLGALIGTDVVHLAGGIPIMVPGRWLGDPWVFWLGSAACAWTLARARRRGSASAVVTLSVGALSALVLVNPLIAPFVIGFSAHMARRLAKLLQYAPLVGIAWGLAAMLAGSAGARRRFVAVAGVLAAAALLSEMVLGRYPAAVPKAVPGPRSIVAAWATDRRVYWGGETLERVREALAGESAPVVAGTLAPVYQLTGLADVRALAVVEAHSPYHVEVASGAVRRADMARLIDPSTPQAQRRALLERWDVGFVVFDHQLAYLPARLALLSETALFERVVVTERLTLLRVRR